MSPSPLLSVSTVTKHFQGVQALREVDISLVEGSIHGIVGPNGAGKTTLLNVISGYVRPESGDVRLDGKVITRLTPQRRVPLGVVRTFQNIRLFGGMTVLENVLIGQHSMARTGALSLWPQRSGADKGMRREAEEALDLFGLQKYRNRRAAELPYGLQKQLEMARALAAKPRVLLLDEPAAGMTAEGREALVPMTRQLQAKGLSILIVEHDMDIVSKMCDVVTVLDFGCRLTEGSPGQILANDAVRAAYLGT